MSNSADFEVGSKLALRLELAGEQLGVVNQRFYGQDETDTACPELAQLGAETFRRNGAHHYDGNYGALADAILGGFKERAGLSAK